MKILSSKIRHGSVALDSLNSIHGLVVEAEVVADLVDHDVTDEMAAYKLADEPFPGYFGIFYKVNRPTKNANEAKVNASAMTKFKGLKDWEILKKNFDRMK